MARPPIDLKLAAGVVLVLVVAAPVAWMVGRPAGRVTVGATLAGGSARASLRLAQPFRATLALDRPLGDSRRVDVELRRIDREGERVERMWTARGAAGDDELFVAFPVLGRLIDGPGRFRVVFVLGGRELGAAELEAIP